MRKAPSLWTIILAGGEGTRLRQLTYALHGENRPKQFAFIQSNESLLQSTVARASRWSPAERTVVVVAREREHLARSQLAEHENVQLVGQPLNLGTGPGILLPLARIMAEDPAAHVIILPADHYVQNENRFLESILHAGSLARERSSIVLVGAVPDAPETQYGWIVTTQSHTPLESLVSGFHEKPSAPVAERLLREGALWNTFVMAGAAERFWALTKVHLPEQHAMFESYRRVAGTAGESQTLVNIYERMGAADFSRDVLEKADGLGVVALAPCGWSDWGTPDRVLESLRGSDDFAALMNRLSNASTSDRSEQRAGRLTA